MKAVVQRVKQASVSIDGVEYSTIGQGLLVLLGIHKEDSESDIEWIARKVANLRVFEDEKGQMNQSSIAIKGDLLVVSQFTLIASNKKGNRPSFNEAASPNKGNEYYLKVVEALKSTSNGTVKTGVFAADMEIALINDGPVTILFDTRNKE